MNGADFLAKRKEGVSEKLISSAKAEFIKKGYSDASLRTICETAGTTTGSVYTRYGGKEGLFEEIVGKHYDTILSMFKAAQSDFSALPETKQPENLGKISGDCLLEMLKYCYRNSDEVRLLLCGSEGTRFSGLIDEMVEIETAATHDYMAVLERLGRPAVKIDRKLEHIIITGMFQTFFEMVVHEMPFEDAEKYLREMRTFYTAGWAAVMGQ